MSLTYFHAPSTFILAGCTSSGKSTFVKRLLKHRKSVFDKEPRIVYYFYGVYSPEFLSIPDVNFIAGLPESFDSYLDNNDDDYIQDAHAVNKTVDIALEKRSSGGGCGGGGGGGGLESNEHKLGGRRSLLSHKLIVIDDLQSESVNSKAVENLFTRDSHHKNTSVIYLTQNLFYQGRINRTLALNAQVVVLFSNPRAASQIRTLQSQVGIPNILEAYNDAVSKVKFGYLVIDLSPFSNPKYRLRTAIFSRDVTIIYS